MLILKKKILLIMLVSSQFLRHFILKYRYSDLLQQNWKEETFLKEKKYVGIIYPWRRKLDKANINYRIT